MIERAEIVRLFCEECIWARAVRTHFAELFERGETRHRLLGESANTFFHDLNVILLEYVLLQQCKLTDPATSGKDKDNLTSEYLLTLPWSDATKAELLAANDEMQRFRTKVVDARRKLIAHSDLRAHIQQLALGSFTEAEENSFWVSLQNFVNVAHDAAIGGPFEIDAAMPDGDAAGLLHRLADAADYDDVVEQVDGFLLGRVDARRYGQL